MTILYSCRHDGLYDHLMPIFDRLFSRTEIMENGCWEYTGSRFAFGHGKIKYKGKTYRTHRVSFILCVNDISDNLHVLHKCDNPPCINPDHLFEGTQLDNMRDMIAKGRRRDSHGENNSTAKLTNEQVRVIKLALALGLTQQTIADKYNVGRASIGQISRGNNWRTI